MVFHHAPSYCPVDVPPNSSRTVYYAAIVTGPVDDAEYMHTTIFNANYISQRQITAFFHLSGGGWRADPSGNYPAATVTVLLNQENSDHAVSFVENRSESAELDLTYRGTALVAVMPQSLEEGQQFNLQVAPQGNILVEPIEYQWFRGNQPLGDPTTSHSFSTQIFGSGMTVVFRVEGTDAIGQVSSAKGWVSVPANCGNPPCPEQ